MSDAWGGGRDGFVADVAVRLARLQDEREDAERRLASIERLVAGLEERFSQVVTDNVSDLRHQNGMAIIEAANNISQKTKSAEDYLRFRADEAMKEVRTEIEEWADELKAAIVEDIRDGEGLLERAKVELNLLVEAQRRALSTMRLVFVACLVIAALIGFHAAH